MLRVSQDKEEIVIREIPLTQWILHSVLAVAFALICFVAYSPDKPFFDQFWALGMGFGGAVNFFLALAKPVTTTKINKPGQTVSVRTQSLIKYSFTVYSFSEIADSIYVDATEGGRGTKVYQLVLPLKNGEKVELSTMGGSKDSQYFDAAELMNPYIPNVVNKTSKQIPFKLTIFEDD